jgi:hypothetical protein
MSESMREDFEAAYMERYGRKPALWNGIAYLDAHANGAWFGWQASRAALRVELPLPVKRAHHEYDLRYNEALDNCEEAIHAAGVKTK